MEPSGRSETRRAIEVGDGPWALTFGPSPFGDTCPIFSWSGGGCLLRLEVNRPWAAAAAAAAAAVATATAASLNAL